MVLLLPEMKPTLLKNNTVKIGEFKASLAE